MNNKLNEISITQPLKKTQDSIKVAKLLRANGWYVLGIGLEAAVAEHPKKKYVIKVYPDYSKYNHFVDFAHTVNSPHVPKFGRMSREIPGTRWKYVRMEKLKKVSEGDLLNTYLPEMISVLALEDVTGTNMMTPVLRESVEEALHNMGFDVPDLMDARKSAEIYKQVGGTPPKSWTHVLKKLNSHSKKHVGVRSWDLHADNFMHRNNTLVIVDPFV